jgi:hypothetical protein
VPLFDAAFSANDLMQPALNNIVHQIKWLKYQAFLMFLFRALQKGSQLKLHKIKLLKLLVNDLVQIRPPKGGMLCLHQIISTFPYQNDGRL